MNEHIDILPEIRQRWSPKTFSEREVEISKLKNAFEAARWAASSYNEQPWRFMLGIKGMGKTYDLLMDALLEKNKLWAQSAPVLMLVCCKQTFTHKEQSNRCAFYDTGAAVSQMVLQLFNDGLYARQIAGLDVDTARKNFSIPAEYAVICAVAVGYLSEEKQAVPNGSTRARKEFDDFVFSNEWNSKSELF